MDLTLPLAAVLAAAAAPPLPSAPADAAQQPPPREMPAAAPPRAVAGTTPAASAAAASFGAPASATTLAGTRGGADTTVANEMQLSGTVSGNSAANLTTGSNLITGGAFANASGLPTVIQNSGANVLIQNATIINLQVH